MEWISIKDKKPTNSIHVLVCDKDQVLFNQAWYIEEHNYFCIGNDTKETWPVEFWFPFPNQPERSKREDIGNNDAVL